MGNIDSGLQDHEKPCLVQAGQGFSVLYKGRFLYSKYAPEKTILHLISSLKILQGTLLVISSPALWHGLSELLKKLPQDCFVLAVEADKELYDFSRQRLESLSKDNPEINKSLVFIPPEKLPYIVNIVLGQEEDIPGGNVQGRSLPPIHTFRRAVYLEFSGGASLNDAVYKRIAFQVQSAIGSFWKNRLTLTRLGRLYTRNTFKNLAMLPRSIDFSYFLKKIKKPVFIFGAGESTVKALRNISKESLKKCFLLCVDAALPVLSAFSIVPDAVVAVESQLAIEKAYIGNAHLDSLIFADLSSRPGVLRHTKKGICFFASDFTKTGFLDSLKSMDFFPKSLPALGSVGLTASYIALLLRKNESTPVFASGLDFDFSLGKTHAQNAPAHIARLIKTNRLLGIADYNAAFRNGASKIGNINGKDYYTDISLSGYAESFKDTFSRAKNFFSCSESGLDIGLPFASTDQVNEFLSKTAAKDDDISFKTTKGRSGIIEYMNEEESALKEIKTLLSKGRTQNETQQDFDKKLEALLSCREYLFLHFPDGYKYDIKNLSFLKRVRSEIDFFLKDIKSSLRLLQEEN